MTTAPIRYERYEKACACLTTATTNRIVFGKAEDRGDKFVVPMSFEPGPTCDGCDKPWKKVAP